MNEQMKRMVGFVVQIQIFWMFAGTETEGEYIGEGNWNKY